MDLPSYKKSIEAFAKQFPLFKTAAYDYWFSEYPDIIGLRSTSENQLKRKFAACILSMQLGIKSLDYTLKKYVPETPSNCDSTHRLDIRIEKFVLDAAKSLSAQMEAVSGEETPAAVELSLFSLQRFEFSSKLLINCAHSGALIETVAISRALIDKLAWAYRLSSIGDEFDVYSISATKSIGHLSKDFLTVGKFYGWLSKHIHWDPRTHNKSIKMDGNNIIYLYGSSYLKALSMLVVLITTKLYFLLFNKIARSEIAAVAAKTPDWPSQTLEGVIAELDSLAAEIESLLPSDKDIQLLAEVCAGCVSTQVQCVG